MTRPVLIRYDTIRDRVEQAHARGWDTNRIVAELGIKPKTVKAVIDAMDRANESGDGEAPSRRGRKKGAA